MARRYHKLSYHEKWGADTKMRASPRALIEDALAHLAQDDERLQASICEPMFGDKSKIDRADLNLWLRTWVIPELQVALAKLERRGGRA